MATIALVACAKTKEARATYAASLYKSALFRKSLLFGLSNADRTYILSAKHGLLALDAVVAPYDVTLKNLSSQDRAAWSRRVSEQLKTIIKSRDRVIVLAGREYFRGLLIPLAETKCKVEFPLDDLSMGNRLRHLINLNKEISLSQTVSSFYRIMRDLYSFQDGGRRLIDCSGKLDWPQRGVYFFLEEQNDTRGRMRRHGMPRITRIGTHAVSLGSKTTLWDRLSTHRGTSEGLGSHRSSIFRLHVGHALVRAAKDGTRLETWGVGQSASADIRKDEANLERKVSETLGLMKVLWLDVPDSPMASSDRAFVERNAIGALSRYNLLNAFESNLWLGNYSAEYRITLSGLWNLNHLFEQPHGAFLGVLQHYVDVTLRRKPAGDDSVAPGGWNNVRVATTEVESEQYKMFDNDIL